MYKLQHDGLLHAEHATIFKATLRSFSGGEVKTYSLYDTRGIWSNVSCVGFTVSSQKSAKKNKNTKAYHESRLIPLKN